MAFDNAAHGADGVLEREGCALHAWVRKSSKADAPLVMVIHGAGVDHRMWASQIDEFAAHYRVLTFDVRGHGLSRPASRYSFVLIVDDAFARLDRARRRTVDTLPAPMREQPFCAIYRSEIVKLY